MVDTVLMIYDLECSRRDRSLVLTVWRTYITIRIKQWVIHFTFKNFIDDLVNITELLRLCTT